MYHIFVLSSVDGHLGHFHVLAIVNSAAMNIFLLLMWLSRFSRVRLCATPWTAAHQAPLSLGFSRQEHWSGLPGPASMHASMLSCFSRIQLSATPWTAANQAPLFTASLGKNTGVGCHFLLHVSFWITVLSRFIPRSGIVGSYDSSIISFLRIKCIIANQVVKSSTLKHAGTWRMQYPWALFMG